jgi:hypothetical protein
MNVFEKIASFKPKYIIPGHGSASGLSLATNNTYHYKEITHWAKIGFC